MSVLVLDAPPPSLSQGFGSVMDSLRTGADHAVSLGEFTSEALEDLRPNLNRMFNLQNATETGRVTFAPTAEPTVAPPPSAAARTVVQGAEGTVRQEAVQVAERAGTRAGTRLLAGAAVDAVPVIGQAILIAQIALMPSSTSANDTIPVSPEVRQRYEQAAKREAERVARLSPDKYLDYLLDQRTHLEHTSGDTRQELRQIDGKIRDLKRHLSNNAPNVPSPVEQVPIGPRFADPTTNATPAAPTSHVTFQNWDTRPAAPVGAAPASPPAQAATVAPPTAAAPPPAPAAVAAPPAVAPAPPVAAAEVPAAPPVAAVPPTAAEVQTPATPAKPQAPEAVSPPDSADTVAPPVAPPVIAAAPRAPATVAAPPAVAPPPPVASAEVPAAPPVTAAPKPPAAAQVVLPTPDVAHPPVTAPITPQVTPQVPAETIPDHPLTPQRVAQTPVHHPTAVSADGPAHAPTGRVAGPPVGPAHPAHPVITPIPLPVPPVSHRRNVAALRSAETTTDALNNASLANARERDGKPLGNSSEAPLLGLAEPENAGDRPDYHARTAGTPNAHFGREADATIRRIYGNSPRPST